MIDAADEVKPELFFAEHVMVTSHFLGPRQQKTAQAVACGLAPFSCYLSPGIRWSEELSAPADTQGGSQSWHGFCSDIARSYGDIMSKPLIVALLLISAAPAYAQNQEPDSAKLKTDAQKVISIISRDRLKTQTYCQILELSDQIDQDENPANTDELAQKIDNLEGKLGPEFMTLVHDLSNMDSGSRDAQDIHVMIESLDSLCGG